ncbi:MAG: hypothetical protein JW839_20430 [Candidatus Lokiarchaeota archaeon]|nr:hypothetical protein [Candidatus Lokiarchaeota archaeon]
MQLHYCVPAELVLDRDRAPAVLDMLQGAGVGKIWLQGYFFGHLDSSMARLTDARAVLEQRGFQVGIISMPVGHPGNSLDPDDPTLDLRVPAHWRYRVDRYGSTVYHCADIEERMLQDNVQAMERFKEAGFTDVFLDDDFRMGNHGPEVAGCFCDACIAAFNAEYDRTETRESLGAAVARRDRGKLIADWTDYICEKVTRMAKALALPGMNLGIMVMHRGDDRHGIRVADWKPFVRHLRVGEAHFGDRDFDPPRGKASEIAGMQIHAALMSPAELYSETTGFPPRALSAANWVCKAKLAVALGIPNIFLMGGTWLIAQDYWQVLAKALPGLREVEGLVGDLSHARVAPVHVALGRGDFELPWWALRAGIPARPATASDVGDDGEILLVLGATRLGPEWSDRLRRYRRVLLDGTAAVGNEGIIRDMRGAPPSRPLERPSRTLVALRDKAAPARRERALAAGLRQELRDAGIAAPFFDRGMDIFLAWIRDKQMAVACNLRAERNEGNIVHGGGSLEVELSALEMVVVDLEGPRPAIVARA